MLTDNVVHTLDLVVLSFSKLWLVRPCCWSKFILRSYRLPVTLHKTYFD